MAIRAITTRVSVAADEKAVSVAEVKKQLEIAEADKAHDAYICDLIAVATQCVEGDARIALVNQTLVQYQDSFPTSDDYLALRRGPSRAISSIQYTDSSGSLAVMASSDYLLDPEPGSGVVFLAYNASWPNHRGDRNGILITYTAGDAAVAIPAIGKQAVLLQVANLFENREPILVGTSSSELAQSYQSLVDRLKPGDYP